MSFFINQLIQVNQRQRQGQLVVRCDLNFKQQIIIIILLIIVLKFKTQLGLPFEGEIEFADLNRCLYIHVVFTFNYIINCTEKMFVN